MSAADLDVHLMRLDVDARRVADCTTLLSPDERARAGRFHFERDRRRFTVARATLRALLGGYIGQPPAAIVFAQTAQGKPHLADAVATVHFNVSHAAELAIYAVSRTCIPGIDIEHVDRRVDHDAVARRFFAQREYEELQRVPDGERKRAFLGCWTCKEAIAKAIGLGLQVGLNRIEVHAAAGAEPQLRRIPRGKIADWSLYRVDADPDYVATVAAYRGPPRHLVPDTARDRP